MSAKAMLVGMRGACGSVLKLAQEVPDGKFGYVMGTSPECLEEAKAKVVAEIEDKVEKIRSEVEAEGYAAVVRRADVCTKLWERDARFWEIKWDLQVEVRKMPPLTGKGPLDDDDEGDANE